MSAAMQKEDTCEVATMEFHPSNARARGTLIELKEREYILLT